MNSYSGIRHPILTSPIGLAEFALLSAAAVRALTAGWRVWYDSTLAESAPQHATAWPALAESTDIARLAQVLNHFFALRAARFNGCGSG